MHAGVVSAAPFAGRAGSAAAVRGRDGGMGGAGQEIPAGPSGCGIHWAISVPWADYARMRRTASAGRGENFGEGAQEGGGAACGDTGSAREVSQFE